MSSIVIFCFLIILALLLVSIGLGLRFYEGLRRKKLVSMLRTVTEDGEEKHVNLLLEADTRKRNGQEEPAQSMQEKLTALLSESGLDWTPRKLVMLSAMAAFFFALVSLVIPPPTNLGLRAAAATLLGAFLPLLYARRQRTARIDALEAQLPDALDFLARSMRAGHAFAISLEMVGEELADPLGQEFRALFNEQNLGASLDRALASFARRVPLQDVHFFSSAVLLQRQTGGNLSEILNRLSHIIRERFRLKGQVKAVSAHGRLTATILTLLPIATLGGLMATSPGYLDPLFNDPTGRRMIALGVLAQVVGNFFIRKIVRIQV